MISFLNLWIFFVSGYGIIWLAMILADRKRGRPIDPPEPFLETKSGKAKMALAIAHLVAVLVVSLFIPIKLDVLFWVGLPIFMAGMLMNVYSMYSFAGTTDNVNTTGLYRFTRNPMYIGGFLLLSGLCLMGAEKSLWSILLIVLCVLWIPITHWSIITEEGYLEKEYGKEYLKYKESVPRYL